VFIVKNGIEGKEKSLRLLCALCVSAVNKPGLKTHRRDAECAEIAQRKARDQEGTLPQWKVNLMNDKRFYLGLICNTILIALTSALAANAQTAAPSQRYRIGAGDVLDIRILNRPQLSREAVRVEGDGSIRMPLIEGEIQAACKSEGELANEISKRYLKYYRNPQVDVFVKEYHAREVALIGAVNEQGRYQMQRRLRLLELLSFAKGPTDKAGQTINIVRGPRTDTCANNGEAGADEGGFISLNLNDTLRGEEKSNPYVQSGDIITIPEAQQVYIVGNVYSPKSLALKEPISVSRAIAMAGGPLRDSKTDRIHIVRQLPNGEKSEMYVNLTAIARKRAEDVMLQPNDIVEVQESTGKSIIRSLLGAVAPSVSQLPIRVIP
jgi:polysaccharide export outer membrane protein